eukprot:277631-Heterocapsa_arctica.AAC.1
MGLEELDHAEQCLPKAAAPSPEGPGGSGEDLRDLSGLRLPDQLVQLLPVTARTLVERRDLRVAALRGLA